VERSRRGTARTALAVGASAVALLVPVQAAAFDTAPHFDITGDALSAEGFNRDAVRVAQVNNWFNDLYVNAKDVPQSGHSSWWRVVLGARWYLGEIEHWPDGAVAAATAMHFDSNDGGLGYRRQRDLEQEWKRLLDMTVRVCVSGRPDDPLQCLTALGASLHAVQDFYAHTNWVEPAFAAGSGYDGPGWESRGQGTAPTWFDLAPSVRAPSSSRVYTNGPPSGRVDTADKLFNRKHGSWRSDKNASLATAMNKDWPGRPRYAEAYMAAYFASRQWMQAVKAGVNAPEYWSRVLSYRPPTTAARADLAHDVRKGARGASYWTGHWQGQGEPRFGDDPGPGGSLDDVLFATQAYFARPKTIYRARYERIVPLLRRTPAPIATYPVPSTRALQQATRFVRVRVMKVKEHGAGDVWPDQADFYAEGLVDGQQFLSGFLHGYDSFSFNPPNYPFTFVKAVPAGAAHPAPLTSLVVTVQTANADGAGTDDDVYLRVSDTLRFKLDKRLHDDFERGSTATYSLPVDTSTPFDGQSQGYFLRDIRYLQLEKSPDGSSGAWKLGGVTLYVNGRTYYRNSSIQQWLRGGTRTWRAPTFRPPPPTATTIPIWLALYDADSFIYGGDDHADINLHYARRNVGLEYQLGTVYDATVRGGKLYAAPAELEGDAAEMRIRIDTLQTVPPPGPAGRPPPTTAPPPTTTTPPPPPPSPTVRLERGKADGDKYRYDITLVSFAPNAPVTVICFDSSRPGGFRTFTLTTNAAGSAADDDRCASGTGDHWVVAGGRESNHVRWDAPTPKPTAKPDLVIGAFTYSQVTVKNQGAGAAGPFTVSVAGFPPIAVGGLAAGAEATFTYTNACFAGPHQAQVDPTNQVDEANEANNSSTIDVIC